MDWDNYLSLILWVKIRNSMVFLSFLNALLELGCIAHSMVNGDSAVLLLSTL